MEPTKRKGKVLIPSAMMAVVGMLMGAAVGPAPLTGALGVLENARADDALHVGPDETLVVHQVLRTDHLHVEGLLEAAPGQDLVIRATSVVLGPDAVLRAPDGNRGTPVVAAAAQAHHGSDGHHVAIYASSLVVAAGARIQAGDGGGGGDAIGRANVTAGDGGDGGDIHLHVDVLEARSFVLPGQGGHGGDARGVALGAVPDAVVAGGAGGRSGLAFLNGIPLHELSDHRHIAHNVLAGRLSSSDLCPRVIPFLPAGTDCFEIPLPVLSSASAATLSQSCDGAAAQCGSAQVASLIQRLVGDIDVDLEIPTERGCNTPQGTPGESGGLRGGDGGNACQSIHGSAGQAGGKGSDGWGNCGPGGPGGVGGQGSGSAATGGPGGHGYTHGGAGGYAYSGATGGPGGDGGRGGINHMGPNCPGGPGGAGGNGIGGKATGGPGGEGFCGQGGRGGAADAPGTGGDGGAGGSGNPAGAAGPAGSGSAGPATAGKGGEGLGICPDQAK